MVGGMRVGADIGRGLTILCIVLAVSCHSIDRIPTNHPLMIHLQDQGFLAWLDHWLNLVN